MAEDLPTDIEICSRHATRPVPVRRYLKMSVSNSSEQDSINLVSPLATTPVKLDLNQAEAVSHKETADAIENIIKFNLDSKKNPVVTYTDNTVTMDYSEPQEDILRLALTQNFSGEISDNDSLPPLSPNQKFKPKPLPHMGDEKRVVACDYVFPRNSNKFANRLKGDVCAVEFRTKDMNEHLCSAHRKYRKTNKSGNSNTYGSGMKKTKGIRLLNVPNKGDLTVTIPPITREPDVVSQPKPCTSEYEVVPTDYVETVIVSNTNPGTSQALPSTNTKTLPIDDDIFPKNDNPIKLKFDKLRIGDKYTVLDLRGRCAIVLGRDFIKFCVKLPKTMDISHYRRNRPSYIKCSLKHVDDRPRRLVKLYCK